MRKIVLIISLIHSSLLFAAVPRINLSPCHVRSVKQELRCGTLEVYEDRARAEGRKIPLHIVVLPATGKDPSPDPLFWFSGGPGEAATNEVELVLHDWAEINIHRDVVLVDVRGTGQSNGLPCVEKTKDRSVQSLLESFYAAKDISACSKNLEKQANLSLYNTSLAVDDLDDVRAALGYDKVNISGGSYGTRVVLVYLRRHSDHVRTATLWDVAPTNARMPVTFAADAQAAFDGLVSYCKKEPQCDSAFPDTPGEFAQLLKQAESKPVEVQAEDHDSHRTVKFTLTRGGVAQTVRYMLYSPKTAVVIPMAIHLAAHGNFGPFAQQAYDYASQLSGSISEGYYLSTTCSEDVPFYTVEEAERAARSTFLGNFRSQIQKDACAKWPTVPASASFLEPVHSNVPSLLIEGDLDPVTPPSNARFAAETLPRSKVVVVPRGAHDFEGMENSHCIDRIIGDFLITGDEHKIETSCVNTMHAPPFALKP